MQWFDLAEAKMVSGGDSYPALPFKPNLKMMDCIEMYETMQRVTGGLEIGRFNGIGIGAYAGGFGLISFSLSRSYLTGQTKTMDTPKLSDLQLHLDFKQGLHEHTSFIVILVGATFI